MAKRSTSIILIKRHNAFALPASAGRGDVLSSGGPSGAAEEP